MKRQIDVDYERNEDGMIVATGVFVFTMATATTAVDGCVGRCMPTAAMMFVVTVVRMKSQGRHIAAHMAVHVLRRRPCELERNKEHEDHDDEAAHRARFYLTALKRQILPAQPDHTATPAK